MAFKPNYQFERLERQRQKAAKKAERQQAKRDRSDERKDDSAKAGDALDAPVVPGEREGDT